jgi:hypothetical protein
MKQNDTQLGRPSILYSDIKSNIEALSSIEGQFAFATDTKETGYYDGANWIWGTGQGATGPTGPAGSSGPSGPMGQGISWNEVTGTSQNAVVNNGYITNNGSKITVTLPSTFAIGDIVWIVGKGAGGWKLQLQAGDIAYFGDVVTSSGGYLEFNNMHDGVEVMGITADAEWTVINSMGIITVV